MKNKILRKIPSVSDIINKSKDLNFTNTDFLSFIIKKELNKIRENLLNGKSTLTKEQIVHYVKNQLKYNQNSSLQRVINGTGVVLHTGLGRAPIGEKNVINTLKQLSEYSNLELDLKTGKRGDRQEHIETLLSSIAGSESSMIVNNNAGAVHLAINEFAENKEVIISRGQLVEIGGSFRIPSMIVKSGSKLIEVGTTNRTHLSDYENAITKKTGLILWVHTSNYVVKGFTKTTEISDLVKLGKEYGIPVMIDLGCGELMDLSKYDLKTDYVVKKIVNKKPDIVTFSGDKLLGGPQSGMLVGDFKTIDRMKKNVLARVLRCDKLVIALLEQILRTYSSNDVSNDNLTLFLLKRRRHDLKKIALGLISSLEKKLANELSIEIINSEVEAGSGTLPGEKIESIAFRFNPKNINPLKLSKKFRKSSIPTIGYIHNNKFHLDLKAVLPDQEEELKFVISNIKI